MARRKPENMIEAADIRESETVATAEAKGHSDQRLVSGRSNTFCADDVRVTCPLFQAEYGGATPTSALQLRFSRTDIHRALAMNRQWHSRMPKLTNWQGCLAYSAECGNVVYAVAIWGRPVAREFNGRGYIELRRMAVADDAPKNTATRMIGWMLRELKKCGEYTLAISYQDTGVHKGTIYKASGWTAAAMKKNIGTGWNTRDRNAMQSTSDKVRWEYPLRESANPDFNHR